MVYVTSSACCRRGQWRHRCGRHGTVWIGHQQVAHEPQVLYKPAQIMFYKMIAVLLCDAMASFC